MRRPFMEISMGRCLSGMKSIIAPVLGISVLVTHSADDERPIFKEPATRLVPIMESTARANFAAACANVTRDANRKALRLYALTPTARNGITNVAGYSIEIIYNADLVKEDATSSGAYHQHHNILVLKFAAAEFASGNKELGITIVRLLANAQPDLWWSSPSHPPLTVKKILNGLEANEQTVRQFLKEENADWQYRVKTYGR